MCKCFRENCAAAIEVDPVECMQAYATYAMYCMYYYTLPKYIILRNLADNLKKEEEN